MEFETSCRDAGRSRQVFFCSTGALAREFSIAAGVCGSRHGASGDLVLDAGICKSCW